MKRTYIVAVATAVLLVAAAAAAEVQTREIEYKAGEAVLQGLIAWDDASKIGKEKGSGVFVDRLIRLGCTSPSPKRRW
jgi:opacity protein-like surface antigen